MIETKSIEKMAINATLPTTWFFSNDPLCGVAIPLPVDHVIGR